MGRDQGKCVRDQSTRDCEVLGWRLSPDRQVPLPRRRRVRRPDRSQQPGQDRKRHQDKRDREHWRQNNVRHDGDEQLRLGGDSGGPALNGTTALGLLSGGSDETVCTSSSSGNYRNYFTKVQTVLNERGLRVY
ncbi:trypsin-like serine protease [Streptomyces sp. L06]|nr:trypsin-like serine protease [Streptomyces sp. L06]